MPFAAAVGAAAGVCTDAFAPCAAAGPLGLPLAELPVDILMRARTPAMQAMRDAGRHFPAMGYMAQAGWGLRKGT